MARENNKKVAVAMSGGVDSSVTAALLKKAGFDVVGVFMRLWPSSKKDFKKFQNRYFFSEAEKRAFQVAKKIAIPFQTFNLEKEFKKRVVNSFLEEYKKGVTPNPCVVCNKEIKFGLLLERVLKSKVDYLATGHYVKNKNGKIFKAKDKNKDQSYFLWKLDQKQLKHVLFPVGDLTKDQVKKLAKKLDLPVFNTSESMEICFIKTTVNNFLKEYIKTKPGDIINVRGKILGNHQGLVFYTIGQRKGIGLAGGPFWVLAKDFKRNTLVVTLNEKDLYKKELKAKNINWVSGKSPKLPLKARVKIRYRQELIPAILSGKRGLKIVFDKPQRAVTPGQSVVFYKKQELLGGGIIL